MILDASGTPFPETTALGMYHKLTQELEKCRRDTRFNLVCSVHAGWTSEQFRHWVETGEEPEKPEHAK